MQPIKHLSRWLDRHADDARYLFATQDLRAIFPDMSDGTFKVLLSRAVSGGVLGRACRGIYYYERSVPNDGLFLFRVAARLRADKLNYISLETALSDAGVISQIPINTITIMSSGRSSRITCGDFGAIEFVHTSRKAEDLADELSYDVRCGMWRASVPLALRDMKLTHRNCDLIDWTIANDIT